MHSAMRGYAFHGGSRWPCFTSTVVKSELEIKFRDDLPEYKKSFLLAWEMKGLTLEAEIGVGKMES